MTQQVRLYATPWFQGRPRKFALSVLANAMDIAEGHWIRLPGWRTPFVRYRIDTVSTLDAFDAFPPGPLASLYLSRVTLDHGRWLINHLEVGSLLEIEAADPAFRSPESTDTPPRLPRWLRWLERDV